MLANKLPANGFGVFTCGTAITFAISGGATAHIESAGENCSKMRRNLDFASTLGFFALFNQLFPLDV